MDWTFVFVAASWVAVYFVGRLAGKAVTKSKRPANAPDLRPMCTCVHWFNMHDSKTGECVVEHVEDINGHEEYVNCPCLRYLGPDPALTGMWSPEIKEEKEDD